MFLDCAHASRVLDEIERAVVPGGVCVLNVLVQGTTYMRMFDTRGYCLFAPDALLDRFRSWNIIEHRIEDFEAPEPGTVKRSATLIACRPAASS
jgi:tellurite methyltransferase